MPNLICKEVSFYSEGDETAFFEWLKNIDAIKDIKGVGNEIQLEIDNEVIEDESLRELIAIFTRYTIELNQLKQFLSKDNKEWFYDNDLSYWRKETFNEKNT